MTFTAKRINFLPFRVNPFSEKTQDFWESCLPSKHNGRRKRPGSAKLIRSSPSLTPRGRGKRHKPTRAKQTHEKHANPISLSLSLFIPLKCCLTILQVYTTGNDAEVHPYVHICYSEYSMHFGWAIYITEGALLTFGAFLAWESRHVSSPVLWINSILSVTKYLNTILTSNIDSGWT